MRNLILKLILTAVLFTALTAQAQEIVRNEMLIRKGDWYIWYSEWSDGLKGCAAEIVQDKKSILKFRVAKKGAKGASSFGIKIGDNASPEAIKSFHFRIDNYPPWEDEKPVFNAGYLIYSFSNKPPETANEVHRQLRQGNTFHYLDERGNTIKSVTLKGSNAAIKELKNCVKTYVN